MKHIKGFEKFRGSKPVNEELLGGLMNWFKKMWDKSIKELEALDNDPNVIKKWTIDNAMNPKDDTNVFSQVIKDFTKKDNANDEDCLSLVDSILDPETGSLGKQGIGILLNNKAMQGEKLKAKRAMLEYIINTARNQTITKVKFAGGPTDGKIDPKKKIMDLKDTTHLPELKKILITQKDDDKKKKDETIKWVNTILIPMVQNFIKAIKEDDIKESLNKQGIKFEDTSSYKEGDNVIYLKDGKKKEDWDNLTEEQRGKIEEQPASDIVGSKKIERIDGDNIVFKGKDGKDFIKSKDEIIGKDKDDKGPNAQELAKTLGEIKSDEVKMKQMDSIAKIIKDPEANKDKIDQINKIIGEE